jgi:dihydrofolate reductase
MRNVIFAINITLDGCCDHTNTIADEELLEYYTHLIRDVDLLVFLIGGVAIPSQLIELGLVDEYHFVVQPIVAGEGRRLLEGISLPEKLQLNLVESKIFKSGCVALHYLKQ